MSAILGKVQLRASPPHAKPSAFSWVPFDIHVIRPNGTVAVDFDVADFAPTGKRYYVAPPASGGTNSNDGLTPLTPLATLNYAFGLGDAVEIILMDGVYRRAWQTSGPTIDCTIKAFPGASPVLSMHDLPSWTSSAPTYPNTWQTNRSGVEQVRDTKLLDHNGDALRLTRRDSIAEVDANPGSWYTDGSVVYVHCHDSREPQGDEVRPYLNIVGAVVQGNVTVYLEGIRFEGGRDSFRAIADGGVGPTVYAKRCEFMYSSGSTSGNGFSSFGATTYLQECLAAGSNRDGFNYHAIEGVVPYSVEIDCVGRDNGDPQSMESTLNGSTSHDAGFVARFNGYYARNKGPNVVDVLGAKSWNVCCEAGKSSGLAASVQNSGFYTEDEMWLDSCRAHGSEFDLVAAGASARIRVRNTDWGTQTTTSGGTIGVWDD